MKVKRTLRGTHGLRPAFLTSVAGSVTFTVQILAAIILMPILLSYLGLGGLGLWLMSVSLIGLARVLTIALTGGVVTALSQTADQDNTTRDTIKGAAIAASLVAAGIIAALVIPLALLVDWHAALSLGADLDPNDARLSMLMLAIVISLNLPLQLPKSMLLGISRGYIGHMAELLGAILGALFVVLAIRLDQPIWLLVLLFGLTRLFCLFIIGTFALYQTGMRFWAPDFASLNAAQWIWRKGGRLGVSQLASSAMNPADMLLISLLLGTASNAAYGAVQQIMLLPCFFTMIVGGAFWPVFARYHADGRLDALRVTLRNTLLLALIGTAVYGLVAGLMMDHILLFWLREQIAIPPHIVPALAFWAVLSSGLAIGVILLQALGRTRFLMITMVFALVAKIVLALILLPRVGPAGTTLASLTAHFAIVVLPMILLLPRALHTAPTQTT